MSVYNTAPFLREAVESILGQSFKDFEFLIFDDGSTDGSDRILQSYDDPRIKLFPAGQNKGLVYRYNQGIEAAQGEYLFLMDSDDISLPDRLERQIDFLDRHPEVGMCGGLMKDLPPGTHVYGAPARHEEIMVKFLRSNPFYHPTVGIRRSLLQRHNLRYREAFLYAEDYRLWLDLAEVTRLANLQEVLLLYRHHENSVSKRFKARQIHLMNQLRIEQLEKLLGRSLNRQETEWASYSLDMHREVCILKLRKLLREMLLANKKKQRYPASALKSQFYKRTASIYEQQSPTLTLNYLINSILLAVYFPGIAGKSKNKAIRKWMHFFSGVFRFGKRASFLRV